MNVKPIKIDHKDIKQAIQSGELYFQVGERKYLLMEVEDLKISDCYEVTDTEEENQLLQALENDNPLLSEEEINKMLGQ
ncbi:hypothetical protein [Halalkalibacter sp. APA_J-10(15)]|uniref:hypothetical protein n=1 Tax=Halalkalibacter sp. APA_J-10(15) TaxID=2933805 RepID=UPI001FF29911|nr:hypothetical protein [Halalkalibacter sp. APA_J-10(15)]